MWSIPKFNVGDRVTVTHHSAVWTGIVINRALPDDEWEYEVSNGPEVVKGFPLLAWESEVTKAND